jgi:hypothetical protein
MRSSTSTEVIKVVRIGFASSGLLATKEQYTAEGVGRDATGALRPVHKCTLTYRVVVGLQTHGIWMGFFGIVTYP